MKKDFFIGDEWMFFKLYCGFKTSDRIINEALRPLVFQLLNDGIIDKWFFIRYGDPDLHLRLRFHYTDKKYTGEIINRTNLFLSKYFDNGMVPKIVTDVYERELNRYGENSIETSETLFFYDSMAITDLIAFLSDKGDNSEQIRWRFAIIAVDRLLSDFHFELDEKIAAVERFRDGFNAEFGVEKYFKKRINDNYRNVRKDIEDLFNKDASYEYFPIMNNILDQKSKLSRPLINELLESENSNSLKIDKISYIASLSHMMLNRLFRSNQRAQEMVIYNYLWKHYDSVRARMKSGVIPKTGKQREMVTTI